MNETVSYPVVSIITPCYNDGVNLLQCVDSVNSSNYPNIEHIIIDDGSTDKQTIDILRKIEKKGGRQKICRTPNHGVCVARNIGVDKSIGVYLLFIDSDDIISKDYINAAVMVLEDNHNVLVVACNYMFFGRSKRRVELEKYSLEKLMGKNLFTVTSMLRRSDFLRVNGFNENMSLGLEDWDFWLSILEDGGEVHYLNEYHFFYRTKKYSNSRNNSITFDRLIKLRRIVYENHKELFQKKFYSPIDSFEYELISKSWEYRVGSLLLSLIRKLLKILYS